ncbi:hypothetical protein GCM10022386_07420 [Flavobacterium cheonhonense]|uniref:Uncharacterized protein n=1 Tax=Flavobacterium cheonhonense TaxID=706185 RepID=A0ABP7THS1_9FLAO
MNFGIFFCKIAPKIATRTYDKRIYFSLKYTFPKNKIQKGTDIIRAILSNIFGFIVFDFSKDFKIRSVIIKPKKYKE